MNCCNANSQCDRNKDCPARECSQAKGRVMEAEPWNFPDPSPQVEARDTAFYFVGFVLGACVVVATVGVIANLFNWRIL